MVNINYSCENYIQYHSIQGIAGGPIKKKSDHWSSCIVVDTGNICSPAFNQGTTSKSDPKIWIRHNKLF